MKLKFTATYDRGVPSKERVHLTALATIDLSHYILANTARVGNDNISTALKNLHWFGNYAVKPGDWIIVYTRTGTFSTAKRDDGGTNHFFFWGLSNTLWKNNTDCAVLLELDDWETSP